MIQPVLIPIPTPEGGGGGGPLTFGEYVFALIVLIQLCGTATGFADSVWGPCERFGEKRYHYLLLTHTPTCAAARWLSNEQVFPPTLRERLGPRGVFHPGPYKGER